MGVVNTLTARVDDAIEASGDGEHVAAVVSDAYGRRWMVTMYFTGHDSETWYRVECDDPAQPTSHMPTVGDALAVIARACDGEA